MIAEVWESLKAAPAGGPGVMARRIAPEAAIDVFAAMRKPRNTPMLIVEAPTKSLPAGFRLPESGGFATSMRPKVAGPEGTVLVEMELTEAGAESVFLALVDDVLARVSTATTARQAIAELATSLNRWHSFFRTHGFRGLSRQAQQGLFGELLFLRTVIAPASSTAIAVQAWTGPTGSNQDFEQSGHAFEVKTTSANPLNSVRVSNLRQLDDECVESLHLVVFEVECHENADGTLPQAVEATRRLIMDTAPHLAFEFADRLVEYGYLDQHATHYDSTGYGVRAMRAFSVSDGFPRLVESDVPVGVGDVRYSIALSAISDSELAEGALLGMMEEWFSELG